MSSTHQADALRAHSAPVAALTADGESTVRGVGILSRGYEKLFTKLSALGADFDIVG